MIYGFEKYVACEPYKDGAIEIRSQGTGERKFNFMVSKNLLVPLKVVYPNVGAHIWPGNFVFLKHSDLISAADWSKPIDVELSNGETRNVVIVPLDKIYLVERDVPPEVR